MQTHTRERRGPADPVDPQGPAGRATPAPVSLTPPTAPPPPPPVLSWRTTRARRSPPTPTAGRRGVATAWPCTSVCRCSPCGSPWCSPRFPSAPASRSTCSSGPLRPRWRAAARRPSRDPRRHVAGGTRSRATPATTPGTGPPRRRLPAVDLASLRTWCAAATSRRADAARGGRARRRGRAVLGGRASTCTPKSCCRSSRSSSAPSSSGRSSTRPTPSAPGGRCGGCGSSSVSA